MKKKFKVIDASTGEKFKLSAGQMIVMNTSGIFFLVCGLRDYYMGMQRLSDVCPKYDVIWMEPPNVLCDEFAEITEQQWESLE